MEDLQKSIEQNEEIEIDLGRLFRQLKKKMSFIIAVTVIAIIISLLVTKFLIPKKYESMARIYLKPNITESGMIDYNTLTANSKMVNNYVLMLQGNSLLEDVAEKLKLENEALVKNSLSVSNEADSEIITVSARTKDAKMSKDIVNTTVNLFFESMKDKLDATVRYELLTRLDSMPNHTKLCHGDFNPSNVIVAEDGTMKIVDWAHATQGNASGDAAITYLEFALKDQKNSFSAGQISLISSKFYRKTI